MAAVYNLPSTAPITKADPLALPSDIAILSRHVSGVLACVISVVVVVVDVVVGRREVVVVSTLVDIGMKTRSETAGVR